MRVGRILSSRVYILLLALGGLFGCGIRDAFTAHRDMVARAAGHELTVGGLGRLVAAGGNIPLRRDVVDRLARLWVDYTLVAHRLANGDSLLDSVTVVTALWSDAQQQIVTHYHEDLVTNNLKLTESVVDSAYQAGNHRVIQHILVRTTAESTDAEREQKRRKAERLRQEVVASGSEGWLRANQENEDSLSKLEGGSLGVIERGQTVPEFERVAFSLAPGGVSPVVESDYGYHIVRRPELNEVRAAYQQGLRDIFIERLNLKFIREVQARWEIRVRPSAPELMRAVAEDPMRFKASRKVIGSYLNGDFTMGDFARWLQALPGEYTSEVMNSKDAQLSQFANGLIRNDVLEIEARDAGYGLTVEDYAVLHETLSQDLAGLRAAMGFDSSVAIASSIDRFAAVDTAVNNYLSAVTNDVAQLVIVPPFLAEQLRGAMEWEISPSGVNRALERSVRLRAGLEAAEIDSRSDTVAVNEEDQ
jgi:hypothetical protein